MHAQPIPTMRAALALAMAVLPGAATAQNRPCLCLEFDVRHEQTLVPGAASIFPAAESTQHRVEIVLGTRSFQVLAPGCSELYDFDRDVVTTADLATKTFRERSLLAEVEEREQAVGTIPLLTGMRQGPAWAWLPTEIEHEIRLGFSLDPDRTLDRRERDGGIDFTVDDEVVTRCVLARQEIPAALRGTLARALFYRAHVHRSVRLALAELGRAPALLEFQWQEGEFSHRVELWLVRVSARPPALDLAGFERGYQADDRLGRALAQAHAALSVGPPSVTPLLEAARTARAEGRPLDAYLLLLEADMQDEGSSAEEMLALLADESARGPIAGMWRVLGPPNWAAVPVPRDADLGGSRVQHGYVLDLLRAHNPPKRRFVSCISGEESPLEQALLGALAENPLLTRAYLELAEFYGRSDHERAWACWRMAQRIDPSHSGLESGRMRAEALRRCFADLL